MDSPLPSDRPLRADARRNRDTLVAAARRMFSTRGPDVPMAEIAEAAGVGKGTLYRHFPEQELLIAAVYRDDVVAVCEQADVLLAKHPADVAVDRWLRALIDQVRTNMPLKRVVMAHPDLARRAPDDPLPPVYAEIETLLVLTLSRLLDAAVAQNLIGKRARPRDLLRLASAICQIDADRTEASRMVALLVDGLRHRRTTGTSHTL